MSYLCFSYRNIRRSWHNKKKPTTPLNNANKKQQPAKSLCFVKSLDRYILSQFHFKRIFSMLVITLLNSTKHKHASHFHRMQTYFESKYTSASCTIRFINKQNPKSCIFLSGGGGREVQCNLKVQMNWKKIVVSFL